MGAVGGRASLVAKLACADAVAAGLCGRAVQLRGAALRALVAHSSALCAVQREAVRYVAEEPAHLNRSVLVVHASMMADHRPESYRSVMNCAFSQTPIN